MLKKILIADDVATIVMMVKYILEEEGYMVITASDGIEAVKKVYSQMPDLIIMDLRMPKLNGYQACRLLKHDNLTRHIPIIILTSEDKPIDKFWGMQTGADEYMLKDLIQGFKSDELQKKVKVLLQIKSKRETTESPGTEIDDSGVFARVNDMMDKKLLESTVLNEISYLGRTIYDVEKTMSSILSLLQKIIIFDVGLIFLGEEKKILICQKGNLSEKNKELIVERVLGRFNKLMEQSIAKNELNIEFIEESCGKDQGNEGQELKSFLASELSTRDRIMGILMIGRFIEDGYTDKDNELMRLIVNQTSIVMDNARLYQKVESLSITDELTKMYNKRYMGQVLPQELLRVKRYDRVFSIIMFDIDFFKKFNDTYGHLQGDIILREVSKIARQEIRKMDIPIRYGGEEFIIILPEINLEGAKNVAERIRAAIEKFPFPGEKGTLNVTISLGVGLCTKELVDDNGKKLIAFVDEALYKAKKSGRNRVCIAE
ncbi:MAG: diguanylate cyclase [bacterium]|nr:diguanylate cyclase [bacterium]